MDITEIKQMRKKQLLTTNGLVIMSLALYCIVINLINISFSTLYLLLGTLMLSQAIRTLMKGYSTKSFIRIFEQVAIYEKNKMGKEWIKQRKSVWICHFILSGLFFFQYFLNRHSTIVVEIDFLFMSVIIGILVVATNISMFLHFRKVDRSLSESDFKGYTWKWQVMSLAFGIVLAFLIITFTIFYVFTTV